MFLVVFICALVGLWLRGGTGFFVGSAVGFLLGSFLRAAARKRLGQVHANFLDTTFAVMGALCKADGVVTREEIQVVEQIFGRLNLSPEQKQAAKAAFNRGKAEGFDLDATVRQFARSAPPSPLLFQMFLRLQLIAITADGQVHPAEHEMLVRVARGLGLSEYHVVQLESLLRGAAHGATSRRVSQEQQLEDAYAALGVTREASEAEIKRAYRKMIVENHPDRVAAKGLPESMRAIAEERAREINAAYEVVKKARGFN
ncbi:MAG TPA: co-chaperone DjlA [Polyangiaceae bacterium]